MQITVTNNTSGPIPIARYITLAAGGSATILNAEASDLAQMDDLQDDGDVTIEIDYEEGDNPILIIDILAAADVGGGGTTVVTGFSLKDAFGNPIREAVKIQFGVYDDEFGQVISAVTATLATPTKGTINVGSGASLLAVTTDANGEFECTLTNTADETSWLMCSAGPGMNALIDATDTDDVTFSA